MLMFFRGPLTEHANLDILKWALKKTQHMALATDVDVAIGVVWDFKRSASFKLFGVRMNATIVLNLLVEGAGRVEEILSTGCTADERYLSWEKVCIFLP